MRQADPFAELHLKAWSSNKHGSNRNRYGKTKNNPRASVGRRSANNIQQGQGKER